MMEHRRFFGWSAALGALPALTLFVPWGRDWLGAELGDGETWLQGLALGLGLLALAAWRLNQTRLVLGALGLYAASLWTWASLSLASAPPIGVEDAWLIGAPLGLALALLPTEGALFSRRSAARLALLVLPSFLLAAAAAGDLEQLKGLLAWRAWVGPGAGGPSHGALLFLIPTGLILALRRDPKLGPAPWVLAGSLLGQAVLAYATAALPGGGLHEARAWLLSQSLQAIVLGYAIFTMYWQRVYLDELTGIPNRRALDEQLLRLDGAYSLAMVDIDHFKKFNDTYGHDQGDDVLRLVGKHLADSTQGRAFRYGGEEFCVLLPGQDLDSAEALMEGARAALAMQRFHIRLPPNIRKKTGPKDRGSLHAQTEPVQVTISVGLAAPGPENLKTAEVMKKADQGLYKAKEAGRNQVTRI